METNGLLGGENMNLSLRTKLCIVFSIIIIVSITSYGIFANEKFIGRIDEHITYNNQQLCIKISENVDTYVEKFDDITKKLISDPKLLQIMRNANRKGYLLSDYEKLKQDREISNIVSNAISLTSFPYVDVYLYSQNQELKYSYKRGHGNYEDFMSQEDNVEKLQNKKLVIHPNRNLSTFSFVRAIFDISGNEYGYIELQSDEKKLHEISNINGIGQVILIDEKGTQIYPSKIISRNIREGLKKKDLVGSTGSFELEDDIYFYSVSNYSGLTTFIAYPLETIYSPLRMLQASTWLFLAGEVIVSIVMVLVFSKLLMKPLSELTNSVLQVTYEDMGLDIKNTYNNEVMKLRDAFRTILEDLKFTAEREIASNQAEARARLSALQAQISPHFIHNVLYSISISAKESRTDDVVSMCKQLSDMLRYTVNSSVHSVRLQEEIECIKNYLELQMKYYEDFLEYEIGVDEQIGSQQIPRLSVLPFVENAIQHAFEGKRPPYSIKVSARIREDQWSIQVEDNGRGFPKDKIAEIESKVKEIRAEVKLNQKDDKPGMGGVGIVNSIQRLKMFYGNDFKFQIVNKKEEGGAIISLEGMLISDKEK